MAVLATLGAIKQSEHIRTKANEQRALLNKEMDVIAKRVDGVYVAFGARASETGKLYGSITTQMVAEALAKKTGVEINRRQIDSQPVRTLGTFRIAVRLTVDLVPHITVVVHREGEQPNLPEAAPAAAA